MTRGIAIVAFAALCAGAQAQVPQMSAEDLRTVYTELAQTHDGFVYTVHMAGYSSEESARKIWQELQQPRMRMVRLNQFFKNVPTRTAYLFTFDPSVRERLVTLYNGERAGPIKTPRNWVIVELVNTQPAQVPPFASVEVSIPGLVAAGALPSAEQLRSDPDLRKRSAANAVRTVADLRAAPADLDVNRRLSSGETLLIRSLLSKKDDLFEDLLKRGADPNACARKFCPLHLAIFRGEAGLANRLIGAGAQVNGPSGFDTPLMAAASAAQRPMAELLIAKGADVFAVSRTTPERTALDVAERSKNAEFAVWLRGVMLAKAKESGQYAWEGWIEQDGKRHAVDGKPVTLKRAPFRIVLRMKPERIAYAAASTARALFDEMQKQGKDGSLHFNGSITFESKESNHLVVHVPRAGERWGGSQAWSKNEQFSSFASIKDTPQGREYTREIAELSILDGTDKSKEVPVASFDGKSIFLILGTRIRMTFMNDEVFGARNVELRFTP